MPLKCSVLSAQERSLKHYSRLYDTVSGYIPLSRFRHTLLGSNQENIEAKRYIEYCVLRGSLLSL
jgi:hypothetical protein